MIRCNPFPTTAPDHRVVVSALIAVLLEERPVICMWAMRLKDEGYITGTSWKEEKWGSVRYIAASDLTDKGKAYAVELTLTLGDGG